MYQYIIASLFQPFHPVLRRLAIAFAQHTAGGIVSKIFAVPSMEKKTPKTGVMWPYSIDQNTSSLSHKFGIPTALFDAPKVSNLYYSHRLRHDYRNDAWYFYVFLQSLSTQDRPNRNGAPESKMNAFLRVAIFIYKIIFFAFLCHVKRSKIGIT